MGQRDKEHPLLGRVLHDSYEVVELIGRGGMGAVFRARQLKMDRDVALKVIHRRLSEDDKAVTRFDREARATSRLKHPNNVRVFDFGKSDDGSLFMVMEYLEGQTLAEAISQEGPFHVDRVVHIARQMFKALGEAHQLGLVHRDLKPENIYVCDIFGETDYVKVLDFGIAKAIGPNSEQVNLTQTGFICGTPRYLSPEQALGRDVDGRSDLYSVAVLMYEMLMGRPPFMGENPITVVMKHVHDDPPPLTGMGRYGAKGLRIERLVQRLLAKEPEQRPASASLVVGFLDGVYDEEALMGRRPLEAQAPVYLVSQPSPPPIPDDARLTAHNTARVRSEGEGPFNDAETQMFRGEALIAPEEGRSARGATRVLTATDPSPQGSQGADETFMGFEPQLTRPMPEQEVAAIVDAAIHQTALVPRVPSPGRGPAISTTTTGLERVSPVPSPGEGGRIRIRSWLLAAGVAVAFVLMVTSWWTARDGDPAAGQGAGVTVDPTGPTVGSEPSPSVPSGVTAPPTVPADGPASSTSPSAGRVVGQGLREALRAVSAREGEATHAPNASSVVDPAPPVTTERAPTARPPSAATVKPSTGAKPVTERAPSSRPRAAVKPSSPPADAKPQPRLQPKPAVERPQDEFPIF